MSFLKSIIYGFISGLGEILPVSAKAHQALLRYMFGVQTRVPILDLLVHIGILIAIIFSFRDVIARLSREQRLSATSRRRKSQPLDNRSYFEWRLIRTATFPLFIVSALYFATSAFEAELLKLVLFSVLNAAVLLLADHTSRGNRDARTMSGLDGIVMGVLGALSVLPGISRTGIISSYIAIRGADHEYTVNWAVILGIPAMIFLIIFDIVSLITIGFGAITFAILAGYIFAGVFAFVGCYVGISLLKMFLSQSGYSKFAYYSIGVALFSFILYLLT